MINKVIILAAGSGKRMRESSPRSEKEIPKPLRKLLGIPIIERTVQRMIDLGLNLYIVIKPEDEKKFNEVLWKYNVKYIFQTKPLGTADALYSSKDFISDDLFLVSMGDDISNISRENLTDSPSVFVQEINDISTFGSVIVGKDSLVVDIKEKEGSGDGLANTGIYIMHRSFFDIFHNIKARENGEYYLTDALTEMVRRGISFKALPIGYWKPINTHEDLLRIEDELSKFDYTKLQIGLAKESDFQDLVGLMMQLSKTSEKDKLKGLDPKESFFKILSNENEFISVSLYGKRVISSVMLIIQDNISHGGRPYCHIENVVTDKGYRNMGIALLNIRFILTLARIHMCYKVILNCRSELINYYKKSGFIASGELEMRKNLD
ncbi:MAG: GNAT family N-acetyltransferase [Candidatus Thermoplasmatota archaeon]|jgi:dTDP-glucose pyrophosphorylase|nr:GNAT family N-acetyltransferase [Candidatus Thermoplasmatota archaeon]